MGKEKHPNKGPNTKNGHTKSIHTGDSGQKRAKKRNLNAPCSSGVSSKHTGSMTSAKRPKKASDEATASGWSVESGDCRPSNEGNSKSWAAKPVTKNKYRIPLPTNTNARPQVVAYKRKGLSVEDLYDTGDDMTDDSEWSTDEDYDGSDLDYGMYDEDDFDDLPYQHVYSRKDFDDFDGEYGDSEDSSGSSDSFYRKYILKGERYDSGDSSDEEYEFVNDSNTVYIPYGSAIMRDLSDDKVEFNPENEHGQIIDLPNDNNDAEASVNSKAADAEEKAVEKELEEHNDDDDEEESDNSCPEAVPINPAPAEYQFYNAVDLRMSLAVLKSPIYMYGHLSVQVLSGMLEMWGYQLDVAEKRTVYASGGYNAINLTPLPTPKTFSKAALERIVGKLKPHFIESDIDALMKQFDPATCVLVLLRADLFNASDTVPLVCKLLPDYTLFPTALTLDNGSPFRTTEMLLEIALFQPTAKNVPLFQANRDWRAVQLQPYSRLVVVGGKGTGKSTLCQYLINRHIKKYGRVLLIDLDIGQPLLFLPETISVSVVEAPILGVGCFADVKPLNCQLFGSFNVVSSPQLYLEIVSSLLQYCDENRELEDIPWIINTMGYVVGFGAELTNAIIRLVQPTDLVQLTVPKLLQRQPPFNKIQNYANQLKPYLVNAYEYNMLGRVLVMQPSPLEYRFYDFMVGYGASSESFNPPRRRTIAIMAQLVKILGDTAESFADVKPHMAHINDLEILITRDEHRPSKEMLLSTLNATMVYLCEKLPNGLYNCFGVGIVRSVDDKENVFLLHSLSPEQLAKAKVLALCNTSLPSQVYLQDSPNIEGTLPYLQNVTPATATNQPA